MQMNQDTLISEILKDSRTIAVVGLSPDSSRPSHEVAAYMQAHGWQIIPVNPACAGSSILGVPCFASLSEAAAELAKHGARIDIVDCFRRPAHMPAIVEEAIAVGARCVWMQLGVVHAAAQAAAESAGLRVVADRCIKIEHAARAH
jgi:uncharacterized protein